MRYVNEIILINPSSKKFRINHNIINYFVINLHITVKSMLKFFKLGY